MHKTGTTSIQNSLNYYEDDKFYYARLPGDANHSVPIFSLFSATPEKHFLNRARVANGSLDQYIASVRQSLEVSIEQAGDRTLIVSGEDISTLSGNAIELLAEYFQDHFTSTKVLAYIRPPMSFISSLFQQAVRSGRCTELNLKKLYRNYRGIFEKFDLYFGRDNVILKKFECSELVGGDSVRDFCSTIGVDFPVSRIKRANESSTKEFIALVFQYNRYCKEMGYDHLSGGEAYRMNELLKGLGSTKFTFAPDLLSEVIARNTEDIRWIENRIGRPVDDSITATASAGDVTSENDLLLPVAGARELLLQYLEKTGSDPDSAQKFSNTELFHMVREKTKMK
jgi:hypothetical protein